MSPMDYLAANWLWLLVSLLLGIILGWLFTGLPASRSRGQSEQRANELNAQLSTTQRKLEEAEKHAQTLQNQLTDETSVAERGVEQQAELQGRIEAREKEIADAQAKAARLQEALDHKETELADALAKLAGPVRLFEKASGVAPSAVSLQHLSPAKAPAIINSILGGIKLRLVTTPQDMVSIPAIGKALEQRLYDAGIGTYWEVANIDAEELMNVLQLTPAQRANMNTEDLHRNALKLAQDSEMVGAIWNARRLDDFESVQGISGVYEQRLYDAGISTYEDLAQCTVEQLSGICRAPTTMMPNYGYWISRASELASARASQKPAEAAS